jgi:hypothetical protein
MGGIIILVLVVLVLAVLAVFLALFHVLRNIIRRRRYPEQYRIAVVDRLDDHHPLMRKYAASPYRLVFRVKDEYLVFPVKKRVFDSYSNGDKGELLFQKDRFISFSVTGSDLPRFEEEYDRSKTSTISFYGEAKQLKIDIHSDQAKPVTVEQAIAFYQAFSGDASDWFFVLSAADQVYVQVEHDDGEKATVTDRNKTEESVRTCSFKEVEDAIRSFYHKHDRRAPTML